VSVLRIATYDEIDPEQAMVIHQASFGQPMTPDRVKQIRQLDKRCSDYFGVYALDGDGQAISQVLVLHIETQTRSGREKVAGIAAVSTRPGHARRGLATALMQRVHELTYERGIRVSMLLTSASLVAHEMYVKLGYSTLGTFPLGYKRLGKNPPRDRGLHLRKFNVRDAGGLDELFAFQTRGWLGFVHRPDGYMAMKVAIQQVPPEQIKVARAGDELVGYVRSEKVADCIKIYDLVGIDDSVRSTMLDEVECQSKAKWALCHPAIDPTIYRLCERRGYNMHKVGWGRVMATSIDASLNTNEIANMCGVDENRFVLHRMDMF